MRPEAIEGRRAVDGDLSLLQLLGGDIYPKASLAAFTDALAAPGRVIGRH